MSDVRDRVVIVTGAGQGLGRAYARRFAAAGALPVVADVNEPKARAVADEIARDGGRALAVPTDVTSPESVDRMVAATLAEFGRLDVLVNNAALSSVLGRRPFHEIPVEEWRRVLDVNVTGSFLCARAVVPAMRAAGWGRIVNISSSTVLIGRVHIAHYVTSKAAVIGLTRTMARELGPLGITVNVVLPGLTRTEVEYPGWTEQGIAMIKGLQSIPRLETPDDLADVLLFLASDASRFITGQSIVVDGGLAHL
jgi:3-oxoacyl-[acyl-carrier protein] reductase